MATVLHSAVVKTDPGQSHDFDCDLTMTYQTVLGNDRAIAIAPGENCCSPYDPETACDRSLEALLILLGLHKLV